MATFHSGWHLIYTKPRHEKKVNSRLTELKIDSYLPTRKVVRTWHDRKRIIDEPLFPSYVFVYLNDVQNYYDGIDTEGSLYYVKTGKEVARVSETIVNSIKLINDQCENLEVMDHHFQPGHRLVISRGALAGLSCEVVEYKSEQKLLVRVDLLRRSLLLTLPDEYFTSL
jgi:transcriptional antiterminator RfaH